MIDLNTIELLTIIRTSLRKSYHNEIAFTYNDI